MTKKKPSRVTEAILEMADDMHRSGLMNAATYEKITVRHLRAKPLPTAKPIRAHKSAGCAMGPN